MTTKIPVELSSTPSIVDNGDATAITIDSSENVGIGITSPSTFSGFKTLHFKNDSGDTIFLNESDGGVIGQIRNSDTQSIVAMGARSNHALIFTTNDSERMRIDSSGRVLLGTTSIGGVGGVNPTHWSEAMTGTAKWCHTFRSANSNPYGIAVKFSGAAPNSTGNAFIYCEDNTPAPRFSVRSNGGIHNYSGNNVNLSDEREKKNIVNADNQLENIKNLLIKSFHYNEDDNSAYKKLGVIAQEVETNLPHLVSEYSNIDGEERKGVKEQQLMWMAIKAIQEQQDIIEDLQTQINEIKNVN